jgi:hypothetical protein
MSVIRCMKAACVTFAVFYSMGMVAHGFNVHAFKSLKHVSTDFKPKALLGDFDDFVSGLPISSVLHAIMCYALCCLAERFQVRRRPSEAESDFDDNRRQLDPGPDEPVQ